MAKRKKKKKDNSLMFSVGIIFVLVILIIIFAIIVVTNGSKNTTVAEENTEINVVVNDENITANANATELEFIQSMTERNRIEYYVSRFIKYVENGEYSIAYDMLNDVYKENYFPTLSDFKEYAEATFTKLMDVEYTNIERNGETYVIWLTLTDAINGGPDSGTEMTFVVKEADFNDVELSFSVI